jgi:hypothetical protein
MDVGKKVFEEKLGILTIWTLFIQICSKMFIKV